ncbi:MAG: ABC transporter substrate-binding protein [Bacteroidota bacterium]
MRRKVNVLLILLCFAINVFAQSDTVIRVALIMPFCGKQLIHSPNNKNAELANACREYYQGMLIACDTLRKAGYDIEITVFDTERDSVKFLKILNKEEVQNAHFIIGPVVKEGQLMMQNYNNKKNAYQLSPLFTFTKTKINNPKSISAYPDLSFYADYVYAHLTNLIGTGNLIVLTGKDAADKALANRFKELSKPGAGIKVKTLELTKKAELDKLFSVDKPNTILFACDDESQINAVLNTLNDTTVDYKISTYGLRKMLDFKSIDLALWENCNMHIVTPFYVDYSKELAKKFIETYRIYYETEPSEYAIVGYDQFFYSMYVYKQTNGNLKKAHKVAAIPLMSNQFLYKEKTETQGLQNGYLNILKVSQDGLQKVD